MNSCHCTLQVIIFLCVGEFSAAYIWRYLASWSIKNKHTYMATQKGEHTDMIPSSVHALLYLTEYYLNQ